MSRYLLENIPGNVTSACYFLISTHFIQGNRNKILFCLSQFTMKTSRTKLQCLKINSSERENSESLSHAYLPSLLYSEKGREQALHKKKITLLVGKRRKSVYNKVKDQFKLMSQNVSTAPLCIFTGSRVTILLWEMHMPKDYPSYYLRLTQCQTI